MADILALADARAALRLPAADTSHDADLTATYIPAVTSVVENFIGPVMTKTGVVWNSDGGRSYVLLPSLPSAVTSVVETGVTLVANNDYTVNYSSGIVTRGSVRQPYIFLPGQQNIVITYNAGYAAAPANVAPNVKLAARIILAQIWQADQQGARPAFGTNATDVVMTPAGFAIPRRAFELLAPGITVPGFA